jgi:hypothetical protein
MLAHAGLSFTDVALSIGTVGGHDAHSGEIESLRRRLRLAETDLASSRRAIDEYKVMVKELQSQVTSASPRGKEVNLRRPLEAIETRMRTVLRDGRLSKLSDRELARAPGFRPRPSATGAAASRPSEPPLGAASTVDRKAALASGVPRELPEVDPCSPLEGALSQHDIQPTRKGQSFPRVAPRTRIANAWDAGSARILAGLGFQALADLERCVGGRARPP